MERIKTLFVSTPQGYAGALAKESRHVFTYDAEVVSRGREQRTISLTMPLRAASWATTPLLPAFQTFLPEGFLRDRIESMFGKAIRMDDMALLALSGSNAIGRLRVALEKADVGKQDTFAQAGATGFESLKEVMADQGTRDLFEYLCDKYLIATSIAGVQPKVVIPVGNEAPLRKGKPSVTERSTVRGRQLIIKVAGPDYPDLAENEFHCMSIARLSGLVEVPPFHLSEDRRRLAVERFDIGSDGAYLGFEDMVSLQGKVNRDKYDGSYENIAKTITLNCSPQHVADSLRRFFATLVLCVLLRNGDAHLKNFGLLYTDPTTDDCRVSPLFDVVCTTHYIPKDTLALSLAKSRKWPTRQELEEFGRRVCHVSAPGAAIDQAVDAFDRYRPAITGPAWKKMKQLIEASAFSVRKQQ